MRRKSRIGRDTPEARKRRAKRAMESKEGNVVRVQKTKNGKNESPTEKEQRLAKSKCKIPNTKNRKLMIKLKRIKYIPEMKEMTSISSNSNCDGLENWQESFAMRLGITGTGDKLQAIVKQEPILAANDFEKKNANLHDSIELSNEVKLEYDCVTDGDTIYSINPILINQKEDEFNMKPNDQVQLEFSPNSLKSSLEIISSGTKFSKMAPIKTKDEAIRFIRLLESFALCKENFRLIGFIERLQNHFEKRP